MEQLWLSDCSYVVPDQRVNVCIAYKPITCLIMIKIIIVNIIIVQPCFVMAEIP